MSTAVNDDQTMLTHRRPATPACRLGLPDEPAGSGGRERVEERRDGGHQLRVNRRRIDGRGPEVAFARLACGPDRRRNASDVFRQARSGANGFGACSCVGVFTSRDPLGGVDGKTTVANPYHYTDNDPLNKTDPLGLRPCDAGFGTPSNGNDLRYDAEERPYLVPGAKSLRDAIGSDRCLLFYNGAEELAAVVVGNLSAKHVMIELAATDTKLENFYSGDDLLGRAQSIQRGASDFAVIAYLGYKTPGGSLGPQNAANYPFPEDAQNRLADLVHALKDRGKHVSMLAHSWSAQVALRYDTQNAKNVDDLVLVGAFATSETNAGDFPSDREWQGFNDDDWILTGNLGDWSPGTRRFSTEGSIGHDYFIGRAADNIRAIGRADWGYPGLCRSGNDDCTRGL